MRAARTVYAPIFLPKDVIIVSFFSFFSVKMQTKKGPNCAIIGSNLSNKHKIALYETQSGEANYVDHKIFLNILLGVTLFNNLGTDIQILQSLQAGWCMYCVDLRLNEEDSVFLEYITKLHLVDIFYLFGESTHSIFPLYFRYIYFLLHILLSQN